MAIKVNGEWVSSRAVLTELTRLVKFYRDHLPEEDLGENREALIRKAKDQAIGARLLLAEARKAGVRVSDAEVAERREVLVREAGGEEAFAALMESEDLEEDEFRRSVTEGLMIDKLVKALVARLPAPTEAEVSALVVRLKREGKETSEEQARDLLAHGKRGRLLTECVALLRKKAVVEEEDDFDGPDIDAIFDSYLDEPEGE